MIIEATATGKTVDEAREAALAELGATDEAQVEFDIITMPKAKTLGLFGGSDAKVRAYYEAEDKPEKKPTVKKDTKSPEKPVEKAPESAKKEPLKSAVMSEEQQKKVSDYLENALLGMGVQNIKIEVVVEEDGTKINFDGDKLGVAIGRKGETLDALQHLVSLVANKKQADYVRITLNPGGYRQKRSETLNAIAAKTADKAIKFGKNFMLEPMNSYERRIIHNAIQEIEGVESWSIGENDHRRVCIGTSRDNKMFRENNNRGRYNRSRRSGGYNNNRGGYNRDRRPSHVVEAKADRAPKSDSDKMPLYGVIK